MKRLGIAAVSLLLAAGVLGGCQPAEETTASSSDTAQASSASASASAEASAGTEAAPSSDAGAGLASSDAGGVASSDSASSDARSSDAASSDGGSSDPVLSGPSGLTEMDVAMNYISPAEVQAAVEGGSSTMVVVDVRKPEDAAKGHIAGCIFAPMNKAVDNNNYAPAILNITSALTEATGNEVGEGKDVVLACYKGKKYAQAATDILNALGADMQHVYTMEGGMEAWNAASLPVVVDEGAQQ